MTFVLIAFTVVVSILAFSRRDLFERLKFNARLIHEQRQWYRFFSYGLIHADTVHLLVNMFVLYSFGSIVEAYFNHYFEGQTYLFYPMLYIGGLGFSTLYDFGKHRNDPYYNAVGASGAVSAVVFSSIILHPEGKIYLFFIPIGIPAPLFGLLYLIYSYYMARRSRDNIGHNAHFWGAVYGLIYTIVLKPEVVLLFIDKIV